MAGEDINMLTMMCTKTCTVKTDMKDVYDFEIYKKECSKGPFHLKYHRVYMKHNDL